MALKLPVQHIITFLVNRNQFGGFGNLWSWSLGKLMFHTMAFSHCGVWCLASCLSANCCVSEGGGERLMERLAGSGRIRFCCKGGEGGGEDVHGGAESSALDKRAEDGLGGGLLGPCGSSRRHRALVQLGPSP